VEREPERTAANDPAPNRREFLSSSAALVTGALLSSSRPAAAQTPTSPADAAATATETLVELAWDLVAANRILADHEVVDGYGHVSVRSPDNPQRYLISSHMAPQTVTPDDLIEMDLDSRPMDTRGRSMQSERFIHGCIYKARPDVHAVVHFHAPATVLMSVSGEPLRPIYHMAGFIGAGVPLFEIRDVAGMTNLLISNAMLGDALARALGDKPAILLRGHGAVVVGKDLPEVTGRAVYLTINAQMQSQVLGRKIEYLSAEEARLADSQGGYPKDWELWKAKVMSGLR
jgi:ribulose-5-phosphate 4-epimerase/fuculose-1-phosphate aldolase